jgi:hypothetical protein
VENLPGIPLANLCRRGSGKSKGDFFVTSACD